MARISGSFTTDEASSSLLVLGGSIDQVKGSISGTWEGATVKVQRAVTPDASSWETLVSLTSDGAFQFQTRPYDIIRLTSRNPDASTSLTYEASSAGKTVLAETRDPEGAIQAQRRQDGVELNSVPPSEIRALDPSQKCTYYTDFLGDALEDELMAGVGSGTGNAVAISTGTGGRVEVKTSSADAADAANASSIGLGALNWRADQGGLVMEARVQLDSVSGVMLFVGFTDTIPSTVELPIYLNGANIDSTATNAAGVLYDTDGTTARWCHGGVKADADSTPAYAASAPSAATYYTVRVEIDAEGAVQGFINGAPIGDPILNAVTPTTPLVPILVCCNRGAAARNLLVDYLWVQQNR